MTTENEQLKSKFRKNLSIAIQAGGKSSRMGQDKAVLELCGLSMIQRVVTQVSDLADEVFVVSNEPQDLQNLGFPIFGDLLPVRGALSGFYTAFASAETEFVAMLACDMPFASDAIFTRCYQIMLETEADVVMPKSGEYLFEPLHAVYRCEPCKQAVLKAIDQGQHRLISWLENVRVVFLGPEECKRLDPSGLAFFNLNTRDDFNKAIALIKQEQNKNQPG
ncbi:MAG TPA: molybdenum cofactor guanylyltransferase [Anaerolineaceae bacterium]|nr:molybdenum cofactor guanylyltransferase [Anaerolineaceae bacterium]